MLPPAGRWSSWCSTWSRRSCWPRPSTWRRRRSSRPSSILPLPSSRVRPLPDSSLAVARCKRGASGQRNGFAGGAVRQQQQQQAKWKATEKPWLCIIFGSGEESERALQELHLPLSEANRQTQPLLRRQAALCGRDQQRDGREAHLQSRCGNGDCLNLKVFEWCNSNVNYFISVCSIVLFKMKHVLFHFFLSTLKLKRFY